MGKTTFMNTLFNTDFTADITPEKPIKTVAITPVTYELTEEDTNLHLCIIDTPGFGDRVNRADEYESTSVIYSRHSKSYSNAPFCLSKHKSFDKICRKTI